MKYFSSLPSLFAIGLSGLLAPICSEAVDFKEDIRPILNKKCFKCHSGPNAKGELRMDSNESFSKRIGGEDPVIIPGDASKSLLPIKAGLPRSDGDAMPPPPARERGAEPLTTIELALVQKWITMGAKFEAGTVEPATPETAAPGAPATGAPAAMKTEVQTWTNTAGVTLQATFVSLSATSVTLKKEDGSQFDYPLANLTPESQALAKKISGQ